MAVRTWALSFYLEATRRFGKSALLLFLCDEMCRSGPRKKCMFFAPVKDGLADYIMPLLAEVFADCPDDLKPVFSSTRFSLTYANGSTILFRGSNMKQHRLRRGGDIDLAVVDEARDVDDLHSLIESVIKPSLFTHDGRLIISSTPADTEEHELHDVMMAAELAGTMFHMTILEAAALDPEDFPMARIEQWHRECRDETFWQREYLAMWVRDPEKTIVPAWNREAHTISALILNVLKQAPEFGFYRYFEAVDFGSRDFTVCLIGFYHYLEATLYIEKELVMKRSEMTTKKFGDRLVELETSLQRQGHIYMRVSDTDPGSQLLALDLVDTHGMAFYQTDKDRLHAMVNKVNIMVGANRIKVSKDCPFTIGSLTNCQWDDDRKEFKRTALYGHADAVAALVYLVRNLVQTNPIPAGWDRQRYVPGAHNVLIPGQRPLIQDRNEEILRQAVFRRLNVKHDNVPN